MKRASLQRKSPMARIKPLSGIFRTASLAPAKPIGKRKSLKSKQRAVTKTEKAYWDRLANEVGCIACRLDGRENHHVSIHHVHGRTSPDCHKKVLPVCGPHHQQDDTDPLDRVAIHPNKAEFELVYGTQERLMEMCADILGME